MRQGSFEALPAVTHPQWAQPLRVGIFSESRSLLYEIAHAAQIPTHACFRSWDLFQRSLMAFDCGILGAGPLELPRLARRLNRLMRSGAEAPLVLVTADELPAARHLGPLCVQEVVWWSEMDVELARAIGRAHASSYMWRLAKRIETLESIPGTLRDALSICCRSNPPFLTVRSVASLMACDRSTLARQWRRVFQEGFRFEDFLHWVILIRCHSYRCAAYRWRDAASAAGTTELTIRRLSLRLTGLPLAELGTVTTSELHEMFRNAVQKFGLLRAAEVDAHRQ
jgi:hypothetical protein